MATSKPVCQTLIPWLKANLGNRSLGALTHTDSRALSASIHIIELYAYTGDQNLLEAFGTVVRSMQVQCWDFAFHGIAHVMDWPDRAKVWMAAGFHHCPGSVCEHEPKHRAAPSPATTP